MGWWWYRFYGMVCVSIACSPPVKKDNPEKKEDKEKDKGLKKSKDSLLGEEGAEEEPTTDPAKSGAPKGKKEKFSILNVFRCSVPGRGIRQRDISSRESSTSKSPKYSNCLQKYTQVFQAFSKKSPLSPDQISVFFKTFFSKLSVTGRSFTFGKGNMFISHFIGWQFFPFSQFLDFKGADINSLVQFCSRFSLCFVMVLKFLHPFFPGNHPNASGTSRGFCPAFCYLSEPIPSVPSPPAIPAIFLGGWTRQK